MSFHPQIRLVAATVPLLNALNDDHSLFSELIGSPVPNGWPEFPEAIGFTLQHLRNASDLPLLGRSSNVLSPVEVDHVIAHTLPGPNPSTGVLVSLDFEHAQDKEDLEVGVVWEWRWTRSSVG